MNFLEQNCVQQQIALSSEVNTVIYDIYRTALAVFFFANFKP
jgi:hypothetical protein